MTENRQTHWQNVYSNKGETEVSWFQDSPSPSLELIKQAAGGLASPILDIGGGASRLADALLSDGYTDITVLDLSQAALEQSQQRLGKSATAIQWMVADATQWQADRHYDVWHDRAAFHFLVSQLHQDAYMDRLRGAVAAKGAVIIGTFALDGPEKCSGLPVARHDAASLRKLIGPGFEVEDTRRYNHSTPWGAIQRFQFTTLRRQ